MMCSELDLLPSLWSFINSSIDCKEVCLQNCMQQLDKMKFFRDATYIAKVILVVAGAVHKQGIQGTLK